MRLQRLSAVVAMVLCAAATALPATAGTGTGPKTPTWHKVASPNPKGVDGNSLKGVTCVDPSHCVAVGSATNGYLVAARTSHGWVRQAAAIKGSDATLNGVDCASTTSCLAVGSRNDRITAIHYNGKRWTTDAPSKPKSDLTSLNAVSCPTTTDCWVVGQAPAAVQGYLPLAEHNVDGSWKLVPVSLPGRGGVLSGVDCVSDRNCWAVGQTWVGQSKTMLPLIEHWNGDKWRRATNPHLGQQSGLASVSCVSATDCYAAGNSFNAPSTLAGKAFVEHYNGHSWSFAVKWKHNGNGAQLFGISCAKASRCSAVGIEIADAGGDDLNFILQLGKHGWHQATVVQPNAQPGLSSVACPTTTGCYAVGSFSPGGRATSASLIVHRT